MQDQPNPGLDDVERRALEEFVEFTDRWLPQLAPTSRWVDAFMRSRRAALRALGRRPLASADRSQG